MDIEADFLNQLHASSNDKIRRIAEGILDPRNSILRQGWFILGDSSHSPYWINAFDLCNKFRDEILCVFREIARIDKSSWLAVPWAHETASFSFSLSGETDKSFDFRVGFDTYHEEQLKRTIVESEVDKVTIVGDLAVLGNLYTQAVAMLHRINVVISRAVVVVSRPNPILAQSINSIQKRRVPWTCLLEFEPTNDGNTCVLKDVFGQEHVSLQPKSTASA